VPLEQVGAPQQQVLWGQEQVPQVV